MTTAIGWIAVALIAFVLCLVIRAGYRRNVERDREREFSGEWYEQPPVKIYLSDAEYARVLEILNDPAPPTPALIDLMKSRTGTR